MGKELQNNSLYLLPAYKASVIAYFLLNTLCFQLTVHILNFLLNSNLLPAYKASVIAYFLLNTLCFQLTVHILNFLLNSNFSCANCTLANSDT